jgi:hypothetical protein
MTRICFCPPLHGSVQTCRTELFAHDPALAVAAVATAVNPVMATTSASVTDPGAGPDAAGTGANIPRHATSAVAVLVPLGLTGTMAQPVEQGPLAQSGHVADVGHLLHSWRKIDAIAVPGVVAVKAEVLDEPHLAFRRALCNVDLPM